MMDIANSKTFKNFIILNKALLFIIKDMFIITFNESLCMLRLSPEPKCRRYLLAAVHILVEINTKEFKTSFK